MEMDIYMRRRLVALGGLVAFFIIFVLLVKSCGGDESDSPLTPVSTTGEEGPTALSTEEFISQADAICAEANSEVGALDPTDPQAVADEARVTAQELNQLESLEVEEQDRVLRRFMARLSDVVEALQSKRAATQRGDTAGADEAQVAIDEAEVEARALGERYGFSDCGQFLDAGEEPGGAEQGDTGEGTETPPADTGGIEPPTDTGAEPPPDTGTEPPDGTEPPPEDDTGGITP